MAIYLNTDTALENYKKLIKSKYFVDKSLIIDKLNNLLGTSECYVCITKPRRFGKSSIINMLGAYYINMLGAYYTNYDGTIRIPNKELMKEFEKALKDESFGEVMTIVKNSSNMLKATLKKDTKNMNVKLKK